MKLPGSALQSGLLSVVRLCGLPVIMNLCGISLCTVGYICLEVQVAIVAALKQS